MKWKMKKARQYQDLTSYGAGTTVSVAEGNEDAGPVVAEGPGSCFVFSSPPPLWSSWGRIGLLDGLTRLTPGCSLAGAMIVGLAPFLEPLGRPAFFRSGLNVFLKISGV